MPRGGVVDASVAHRCVGTPNIPSLNHRKIGDRKVPSRSYCQVPLNTQWVISDRPMNQPDRESTSPLTSLFF